MKVIKTIITVIVALSVIIAARVVYLAAPTAKNYYDRYQAKQTLYKLNAESLKITKGIRMVPMPENVMSTIREENKKYLGRGATCEQMNAELHRAFEGDVHGLMMTVLWPAGYLDTMYAYQQADCRIQMSVWKI